MEKGIRIGQFEYFALFVMARVFGSITFVGEGSMPIDTSTALIGQLVAALLAYVLFRLIIGAVHSAGVETPVQLCFLMGKPFGRVATALMGCCSFAVVVGVMGSFERYFTVLAYPSARGLYFIVIGIAAIVYLNHMGIDAMSRLANILFIGLVAVMALLLSGLWQSVDMIELVSPFYEGPAALGSSIYRSLVDWGDLLVMAMAFSMVNGNAQRPSRFIFGVALTVAELLSFLLITVFGSYSRMHLFPVHALFSAAEIWVPIRVDFLFMAVFMSACLIKAGLHLAFVSYAIKMVVPAGIGRFSLAIPAGAAGVCVFVIGRVDAAADTFRALMNSGAPMLVMTLVLPMIASALVHMGGRQRI